MTLEVDYDPFGVLLEALHSAGIECRGYMFSGKGVFPLKTIMKIGSSGVKVKEGFGADYTYLLPKDKNYDCT